MKRILALCMLFTFVLGVFTGCGGEQPKKAETKNDTTKKIVIGLDDNFPPMGFVNDKNQIVGFDVDLAKEAAKRLKREVEFKPIDWASKEAELKSGRIDALWNGLDIIDSRKKNMMFSDPYMANCQMIFVKAGRDDIKSEADLAGKIVATQSGGGTAEEYLDGNKELNSKFKEYKKYADYLTAFMDLENGRIDVIVCDEIIGRYYMSKHPDKLNAVGSPIGPVSHFGVGFRKEDQKLRDEVQKAINDMRADGTMAKISQKWFGKDLTVIKK